MYRYNKFQYFNIGIHIMILFSLNEDIYLTTRTHIFINNIGNYFNYKQYKKLL